MEGEFAIRNPLEQARVRRSHSLRHAGSPRRTNRARPRSNTVRSRISSQAALRRFSEFGFNPGVGGGPRQSFHESTVDFVSEGNEVVVRRKSSVRKSHSPSKEYSQRKESIELEVTEAWNIQLVSLLKIVNFLLSILSSTPSLLFLLFRRVIWIKRSLRFQSERYFLITPRNGGSFYSGY